jgi:antitoxin HicB
MSAVSERRHREASLQWNGPRPGAALDNSMREYTVVLEREEDGGYSVYVPDLPGCASQGDDEQEALANIQEAIRGYIEAHRSEGIPLPEPRARITTVSIQAA